MNARQIVWATATGFSAGLLYWIVLFLFRNMNGVWNAAIILEAPVYFAAVAGTMNLVVQGRRLGTPGLLVLLVVIGIIKGFSTQLALPLFNFDLWKQVLPVLAETMIVALIADLAYCTVTNTRGILRWWAT